MADIRQSETASEDSLQKVVVLLGALLTKDVESLVDKVQLLGPLGLSKSEIARAIGTSEGTVRATQSRLKKS